MTTTPTPPEKNDPQIEDFQFDLSIPSIGKFSATIDKSAWDAASDFMKKHLLWALLVLFGSGTIGAHVLGQAPPLPPKLPGSEMPTQK
jgi:hypothetical protein